MFNANEGAGGTEAILKAIADFKTESKATTKQLVDEAKEAAGKDSKAALDAVAEVKNALEAIKTEQAEAKKQIDAIDKKAGEIKLNSAGKPDNTFGAILSKAIADNYATIKKVNKSSNFEMELKTVGDMTVATNLTGSAVATYFPSLAAIPAQKVNFRNLVPAIQSETGVWKLYRETGSEGSISVQSTPGTSKTQIDYDYTEVTYAVDFLAGFARIARQMLQDLPFLQSELPMELLRDFYKAENALFYTQLTTAATGSTSTTGTNAIEKIIDYVANLLDANFSPSAIVVNARLWAKILTTKPSDYSIPGGVTVDANGNVRVLGLPMIPASWMPANKVIVGDWDMARRVEAQGLSVQFFEQDADNVTKNKITVRIECREVLAILRPDAFVFADVS